MSADPVLAAASCAIAPAEADRIATLVATYHLRLMQLGLSEETAWPLTEQASHLLWVHYAYDDAEEADA